MRAPRRVPGAMPKCFSSASPTRCGGLPDGCADAEVDARLAEVDRQQLRVAVGEVQETHVAERRDAVVEPVARGQIQRGAAGDREARGGGSSEHLEKFAAVQHGNGEWSGQETA